MSSSISAGLEWAGRHKLGVASLLACVALAATSLDVRAASFDCSKASTPIERAICSDPTASAADATMGRLYKTEAIRLSPVGKALFRDSQRSFLHYATDLCRPGAVPLDAAARSWRWHGKPAPENAAIVAQCLAEVFDKRSKALGRAVTPLGGRVFFTTMRYRVRPTHQDDEDNPTPPDAVTEIKALVQIDLPRTQAEKDWNRAMADLIEKPEGAGLVDAVNIDDDDTDVGVEMSLISASPDLVVTRIDLSNYSKGAAHGRYAHWNQNWSLPLGRELTKDDVFDGSKPWSTALAAAAEAHFVGYGTEKPETPITEIGDSDTQWAFTSEGLTIGYDPYSLGSYLSGGNTLIPWTTLAPFLRHPQPFNPGTLEEPKAGDR